MEKKGERMNEKIRELLNENKQYLLKVRRHLHQNPELSEHEFETQKYIINFLEKYNVEYTILAKTCLLYTSPSPRD